MSEVVEQMTLFSPEEYDEKIVPYDGFKQYSLNEMISMGIVSLEWRWNDGANTGDEATMDFRIPRIDANYLGMDILDIVIHELKISELCGNDPESFWRMYISVTFAIDRSYERELASGEVIMVRRCPRPRQTGDLL